MHPRPLLDFLRRAFGPTGARPTTSSRPMPDASPASDASTPAQDAAADATPATPQGDGFETTPPGSPAAADVAGGVVSGDSDLARQVDEHRDRYLRLAAEFDNHRRRTAKERQELGARAQADLVKHLIDAMDDLARFAHLDPASTDAATVVQGVAMVEKKLVKALGGAGLQVVDPTDQAFDPSLHEAVATEPAASRDQDARVARTYQLGYVFGGQLLRPARVVVRQYGG